MQKLHNGNHSIVSSFIIVGFETLREMELLLFSLFSGMYVLTIGAHLTVIMLVAVDHRLHKPMYFLLASFSLLEVLYTTVTVPKMLDALLTRHKEISYPSCLTQFYLLFGFGASENCLLAVMAYDRYVAICRPLHYATLMPSKTSIHLAVGALVGGLLAAFPPAVWISTLNFCFPNLIDHFFCDYAPLLKLCCDDTSAGEFAFIVMSWSVILGCFVLIMVSYSLIILAVLRIPSSDGQKRAFSTCGSHLAVVSIFYGTVIFMYIRPTSHIRFPMDKVISIFYCVVTPLMNPIIYCLRNQEVKGAVNKAWHLIMHNKHDIMEGKRKMPERRKK
ncbi:olfactory receptor 6F1-like [Spea bombifrons]|uniref:olfactory receptor 6F1-like n=1 Tax=Spea bombifrons TaxID=233779 RepID=UPI00234BDE63|nr:olfactory receptor 6F1-like [Spea bombifrons]